ncbi:MAG: SsrA-binding protein [Flavobacteriales bacterium]|nr:SsrA-binding protein [Flavobacteriales bacterium]
MKKSIFRFLASCNKLLLPSFTKQKLNLAKGSKWQLILLAWKAYVTKNTLG